MTKDKIGIWGPPGPPQENVVAPPTPQGFAPPSPNLPYQNDGVGNPIKHIRWGIKDVIWGMVFMILSQIIVAVGITVYVTTKFLSTQNITTDIDEQAITDMLMDTLLGGPWIAVSAISMYVAWYFAVRRASKSKGFGSYAKDILLKINWKRDVLLGLGFAIGLRVLEQAILYGLQAIGVTFDEEVGNTDFLTNQTGFWLIVNAFVIAGLVGPFFEEVFFRGLALRAFHRFFARRRVNHNGQSTWFSKHAIALSMVITSIMFGFMHYQGTPSFNSWFVITQTGLIGLFLAYLTVKTKRLGPAITTHIFFNMSGVILAIALS